MVNCACNPRTLFSFLDLLMRALGVFEINDFELDVMGSRSLPYEVLTFEMNEVPVILCYQAWEGSQDDSRDSPVGHGLQITFPEGVLSLMGSYGPVVWNPLIAAKRNGQLPVFEGLDRYLGLRPRDLYQWRQKANRQAILELEKSDYKSSPYQRKEYLTVLSKNYSRMKEVLGEPKIHEPIEFIPEYGMGMFADKPKVVLQKAAMEFF